MKNIIVISISFLVSSTFLLHVEAQNLTMQQTNSIKNEVSIIFQDMLVFAEKLDFDKLSSGVDDRNKAGFITNGKYYAQYSTLINDVKFNAQGVSKQSITIKEKKVTVLSAETVLMTVSGASKANISNSRVLTSNFHWLFVYEKIDNNWKVIHSHQSLTN